MEKRSFRVLEFEKIRKKLINNATCELGKEIAKELEPSSNINTVKEILKETTDAVNFIIKKGSPPLGGIHNIGGSIKRVEIGACLNGGELLRICDVLRASRNLKNYSNEDRIEIENDNIVKQLISCLETNKTVEQKISMAIVSEEEIADSASDILRNIRRQIRDQQNSIKDRLNSIIKSSKHQKHMQEAVVTIRGDRYVIPIKQEYRSEIPGLIHDMSSSGATVFIEPMAVVEANNSIKQLKIKESAEIERILLELTSYVENILDQLKSNLEILAKLDFIFAKAKLSLDFDCICPIINSNKYINIKKGRHPLLDQKSVVPIDFWLGQEFSTLVITGPNTGGKTVTLKTVGLFTLMTQAGLHIPAKDGTEMSVFQNVFADIGDEQSIEQSLSTFSSHMKNIVSILEKADENSLVMFDELGAGTDPTEGAALATAILESLRSYKTNTIATTHYSELKIYAISTDGVENACCEFDVETLKPTYRLLIGVPGKSNAFAISKRLGLSDYIIERSKEFLTQEDIKFEDMLSDIERNRSESEKERMKAESYRREIERYKNELEEQKRKIQTQKDKAIKEAKEEARRILLEAKEDAEEMIQKIKEFEMKKQHEDSERAAEEIRLKLRKKIDDIDESLVESIIPRKGYVKPPKNLKEGDTVHVINLNQKGTVLSKPDKDGQVMIQAGIIKINVHISNLKLLDEQKRQTDKISASRVSEIKTKKVNTEIDVRGYNIEEAALSIDKFLDDASIVGLNEVSIIHGKGTGVLRKGIHDYLKLNGHVKSFRLGKYGEGETGVTIVEMK